MKEIEIVSILFLTGAFLSSLTCIKMNNILDLKCFLEIVFDGFSFIGLAVFIGVVLSLFNKKQKN